MNRTVPTSGNKEINLYIQTYYSLLRSTRAVQIKSLIEVHKSIHSALHVGGHKAEFDSAAFIYAVLRTPDCIDKICKVIMGQSEQVFAQHGFTDIETWQPASARARRRRSFFDGVDTLAVYIASRSDIDDLVPILTAYQIERNKLHQALNKPDIMQLLRRQQNNASAVLTPDIQEQLETLTGIKSVDWERLAQIWQENAINKLLDIAQEQQELAIRSLAGSLADYKRATRQWWRNVERHLPDVRFDEHPIYFISSNRHAMANLLSGFALQHEESLHAYVDTSGSADLKQEYQAILEDDLPSSQENFLYYVLKKYESDHPDMLPTRLAHEHQAGVTRVPSKQSFDIETQIVSVADLQPQLFDGRLHMPGIEKIRQSHALIINIDYPLGMAAYQVLTEVARNIGELRGFFSMGKAATLNARVGDIMIPNVVHDEHSLNTYMFRNCFSADDVAPYLVYGTVMDNQKAITVPGTFLQNEEYMSVFYDEGYTDMEMEAGPYLGSLYEMMRPKRHPYNEIVNLYSAPFPFGFLHYASDTPFSKGTNLGTQNLSYFGMDATYGIMIAILRTILQQEIKLLDSPPG